MVYRMISGYCQTIMSFDHRHQLPLVVGLRDYSSGSGKNLCFKAGDEMLVINTDGEMWFGYHTKTGKTGYLLGAYVREKLEGKRYSFFVVFFMCCKFSEHVYYMELCSERA